MADTSLYELAPRNPMIAPVATPGRAAPCVGKPSVHPIGSIAPKYLSPTRTIAGKRLACPI